MATKRAPHLRLKKLRKIIGFTQVKLAEKCGVSYPYLLSVETGQRPMSENLAKRISFATGVSQEWLLYAAGTSETPRGSFGVYDTKAWENHRRWDASRFPDCDFGDVGDEMLISDDAIGELGVAMRAAWRLGKFNVAILMLRDLTHSLEKDLKLTAVMNKERRYDVPSELLEAQSNNELPYLNSLFLVLPLLSSLAVYKWSKAFEEGGKKQEDFIGEMNDLYSMILHSFDLKKNT